MATALKIARIKAGKRQADVARPVGIDITTLSRIENGHIRPSLATLQKLARVLAVSLDELAADFPPPEKEGKLDAI